MFVLALFGIALASEWKSEENFDASARPAVEALDSFQKESSEENTFSWPLLIKPLIITRIWKKNDVQFNEHIFLDQTERQLGRTFQVREFTRTHVDGGVWIRGHADELVVSAYMHPTKPHSAAIRSSVTAKILPEKIKAAPAGSWAIACGNPGPHVNEPLYRIEQ